MSAHLRVLLPALLLTHALAACGDEGGGGQPTFDSGPADTLADAAPADVGEITPDAEADAPADVPLPDTAEDTAPPDAGPDAADVVDAGPDAAPDTVDAGPDTVDAGPDTVDAGPDTVDAGPDTVDAGPDTVDAGPDTVGGCDRVPRPADAPRTVVFARPYEVDGQKADVWGSATLTADGTLTVGAGDFAMGRAPWGRVAFTPDGEIGLVPQEGGTLGVLRVEEDGSVTVLEHAWSPGFYAEDVVMGPEGEVAWVVDSNFPNNGGGIYRVDIGCDGSVSDGGRVLESKLMQALVPVPGSPGRFVAAARSVAGAPAGDDVHLLEASADGVWTWIDGADAFGDDDAIVSGAAVTPDGAYALVGDGSEFSGKPNRVAVAALGAADVTPTQVLSPLLDPFALVASPFGHDVLVLSGYGDALVDLSYDPQATPPFTNVGEVVSSALPQSVALVTRGSLEGVVLVAENQGIRLVRFEAAGGVTDLGLVSIGGGVDGIPGAVGVQP